MRYTCVLLLGGSGERMGLGYNKVLYKVNGKKELYKYSLETFLSDQRCERIILVVSDNDMDYFKKIDFGSNGNRIKITKGGKTRGESVLNGLDNVSSEYVMIHDAARPCLTLKELDMLSDSLMKYGTACLASKVYDTISINDGGYIDGYVDRNVISSIKTPQCFKTCEILDAYKKVVESGISYTDDTSVYGKAYGKTRLVFTDSISIKATTKNDLRLLEALLDENR